MKLQTGLLHLDGRPPSADDLAEILGEFAQRPVDIAGCSIDGPALLAYRGDKITFEEDSEVQPLRKGPLTLTWDGRLDNREELGRRLRLTAVENIPDPEIVLNAYEAFGESVVADLVGEFVLVLWCSRTKSLQFARSACGARPLYYVLTKNRLIWSSNFAHLVRVSGVDLTVNDDYAVQYLACQPSAKDSPLVNVHPIPPNRSLHFQDGRVKHTRELWDPTQISPLRYRTDKEYEEHFRTEITQAVRVRLRAKNPIFSELSGGLDSSSIVLIADQILRERGESASNLRTVSCVYEESRSCDERPFIRAVEEKRGIETLLIHECDQRITLGLDNPPFTGLPNGLHCFPGRYETVTAFMRQHKSRVLLTGRGGDHLCWSEPDGAPIVADDLMKADVFSAHRECRDWSRMASLTYYEFLAKRALPLFLNSLWPTASLYKPPELPAWIHPRHKAALLSHVSEFESYPSWRSAPSRRAQVFFVDHMFRYLGSGFFQEYNDLYVSHPYSHRPLVEFCLGIPVSQFLRNGHTRSLMRRALRDLLPQKTRKRVSKGLLDETISRALRNEQASTSDTMNWQVCERGFLTYPHLAESLNQARLGILKLSGPLFRVVSLERWLRSLSRAQAVRKHTQAQSASSVAVYSRSCLSEAFRGLHQAPGTR
jgi:asparagine synthase (glutamine-hydrolysing)